MRAKWQFQKHSEITLTWIPVAKDAIYLHNTFISHNEGKCQLLLNHLKSHRGDVLFFIDEIKFVVDEVGNGWNLRILVPNQLEIPHIMQSKYPALVILFSGVAGDGNVMLPHFMKTGIKINSSEYIEVLQRVMLPRIKNNYNSKSVVFIRDYAPGHWVKTAQIFMKDEMSLFVLKGSPAHLI